MPTLRKFCILSRLCLGLLLLGGLHVNTGAQQDKESSSPLPAKPDLNAPDWKPLFDGESLKGWNITDFAGHGDVTVKDGRILIDMGVALSGIQIADTPPKMNYELTLQAMKRDGGDFFCGLTFPYGESHCSLICGGWGGTVVGISSLDGADASENETAEYVRFENHKWYRVIIRVTEKKIEAWLDDDKVVDLETTDRRISMRFGEIEKSMPLGIATWMTSAAIRDIRLRKF